jgi:hypothetical protein
VSSCARGWRRSRHGEHSYRPAQRTQAGRPAQLTQPIAPPLRPCLLRLAAQQSVAGRAEQRAEQLGRAVMGGLHTLSSELSEVNQAMGVIGSGLNRGLAAAKHARQAVAGAVSASCAYIGSPCLRHCVHGASIGGGGGGAPSSFGRRRRRRR